MPSSEPPGENAVPTAKALATAPTPVISSPPAAGLRTSRFPEIGKVSSTPRSLTAIVVMNPTSRDQPDTAVRGWHEHATSVGEVAQTRLRVTPSASTISRLNWDAHPTI